VNTDWNKDQLRGTPGKEREGLSYPAEKSEYCTPQLKARNEARRDSEILKEQNSIPASDYEYFDRMARELESELEGVA